MPTSWSKHDYVKGFDCESITFKKDVNMFECMKIAESIYEFVVETYHKKPTQVDANRAGHIRQNRGEAALSWTRPNNGESAGKCRKRHVDSPEGKS